MDVQDYGLEVATHFAQQAERGAAHYFSVFKQAEG
jgi:hypothetical protein